MVSEDPSADIVREYNIMKIKEESAQLGGPSTTSDRPASHNEFIRLMRKQIDTIVHDLEKAEEPKSVVKAALQGLHRLDELGGVLQNLMEVVKRDESFSDTVARYGKLGILKGPVQNLAKDQETNSWLSSGGAWGLLRSVTSQFRKIALRLIEILLRALKAVTAFVNVKPSPSIGWSGVLPTISLEFEWSIEGASLNELIDILLQSSDE